MIGAGRITYPPPGRWFRVAVRCRVAHADYSIAVRLSRRRRAPRPARSFGGIVGVMAACFHRVRMFRWCSVVLFLAGCAPSPAGFREVRPAVYEIECADHDACLARAAQLCKRHRVVSLSDSLVIECVRPPRMRGVESVPPAENSAERTPSSGCLLGSGRVPGGTFKTRGADPKSITIRPFCMDMTEVTAQAYAECVGSGKCSDEKVTSCNPISWGNPTRAQHPMTCVSWHQASTFCKVAGKRLPTEWEWEWAARGGDEAREYPWGDMPPASQLCWAKTSDSGGCRVGSYPLSSARWGMQDMAGNVWEWTSSAASADNWAVVRGGGWDADPSVYHTSASLAYPASARWDDLGFRCARTVP